MVKRPIPVHYVTKVNAIGAISENIIHALHENFFVALKDTREYAQDFKGGSKLATAFNVWRFLREKITYRKDDNSVQDIRMPGRLLADGFGDCKSYSLFAASILKNLGFPIKFRYASYTSSSTPTHVYVVTYDKNGSEIIVDGVHKKFNQEVPYTKKRDCLMKVVKPA